MSRPPGRFAKETLQTSHGCLAYRRVGVRRSERLLLIHGLPTSSYLWRHVMPALSRRFDTVAVDLLGFGDSEKPPGESYRLASHAERVREFLDELHWPDCTVVGHDVGGGVAAMLASRHADIVKRLVLVDTVCYDNFPVPSIARLKDPKHEAALLEKGLEASFRRAFDRGMVKENLSAEDLTEYVRPFREPSGRAAYLRALRDLDTLDWMRERSRIENFPRPTLVLWGEKDAFLPCADGERLASAMSDGRYAPIADCGHYVPEDQPDALTRHLLEFVT